MDTPELTRIAVDALEEIKAKDITVMDVRQMTSLFDAMIVASGDSTRQVKALADNVREKIKEAGGDIIGTEGEKAAEWVLVDAGNVVVHVMHPVTRQYYNLEELWGAARDRRAA
ncbi:MAG: ribosome silencing factor [Thiobacillus sp.]|nr:ribosome silencing factor [Thiobacillus sp.]